MFQEAMEYVYKSKNFYLSDTELEHGPFRHYLGQRLKVS